MEAAAPVCKNRIALLEFEEDEDQDKYAQADEMARVVKDHLVLNPSIRVVFFATSRIALDASADLRKLKEFKGSVQFYVHDRPTSCLLHGIRTDASKGRGAPSRPVAPSAPSTAPPTAAQSAPPDAVYDMPLLTLGVTGPVQSTLVHKMAPWLESRDVKPRKGTRKITDMFGKKAE